MKTALDQTPDHGIGGELVMQGKAPIGGSMTTCTHRAVHGLDDVTPDGKVAQRCLKSWLQSPAGGAYAICKAKALQLGGPAEQMVVVGAVRRNNRAKALRSCADGLGIELRIC